MLTDVERFESPGDSIVMVSADRMKDGLRGEDALEVAAGNLAVFVRCPMCGGAAILVDDNATLAGYTGRGRVRMYACDGCGKVFAIVTVEEV